MDMKRQSRKKTEAGISIVLIIGILAVVNFFSYQTFARFDLTANRDYSIAPASRQLAAGLDDLVSIKVFFSEPLPPEYITLKRDVTDILDEYRVYSRGQIKVVYLNPLADENVEREAMMLGIPAIQFNSYAKDKYEIVKGYLGIAVIKGARSEIIPVVQNTGNLEYQISLAVKKVTSQSRPEIALVKSHGALSAEGEISATVKQLQELYEVKNIDLKTEEIPTTALALIIAGPKEAFADAELKKIDHFFLAGKSLLVLWDGVKVGEGLSAEKNPAGLNTILEKYGLRVNEDLVLDRAAGMASFSQGFFAFTLPYPYWPKITKNGLNQENAAVSRLESVVLPWTSSLNIKSDILTDKTRVDILVKTSPDSWRLTDNFNLSPQQNFSPTGGQGSQDVVVYLEGHFSSAFGEESTDQGRLIVAGDSDFLTDRIAANMPDNLIFFQNLVDVLALDDDLIKIRSKGVSERPIRILSDGARNFLRYGNIFALTLIVIIFGFTRYYFRRRTRFADEL